MKKMPYTEEEVRKLKPLKWVVEFSVSPIWVEDGFDLTNERALEMLANDLQYAYGETELGAKVLKAPSSILIKRIQGYEA